MQGMFLPALADSADYPSPQVAMLPSKRVNVGCSKRKLPGDCVSIAYLATARGLLAAIASRFKGKRVLIPAYHCPAMVEPFIYHQCDIAFYRLNEQLEFDRKDIQEKLLEADLVIGVRFFGFSCGMDELKTLARKSNTFMLEDLAHAAFVKQVYGDVAVTSLKKFYPLDCGAELYVGASSKAASCEKAVFEKRLSRFRYFIYRLLTKLTGKTESNKFRYFSAVTSQAPFPLYNRYLLNHYNHQESATLRRANYQLLADAVSKVSFAEALFPTLEHDVVPYVFPLKIKSEAYFSHIRQAGIPLYRWEEMMEADCSVSLEYRRLVVQLPCHQDLKAADMDFIVTALLDIDKQHRDQV